MVIYGRGSFYNNESARNPRKKTPYFYNISACWEEVEVAGMKSHRESKMLFLNFFLHGKCYTISAEQFSHSYK